MTNQQKASLAKHFGSFFEADRESKMKVLEVREVLELAMFEKAALNATEDDIRIMEEIYHQMEENLSMMAGYGNLDLKLHMQIARATHNEIFPILVSTLYESSGQRIVFMAVSYTHLDVYKRQPIAYSIYWGCYTNAKGFNLRKTNAANEELVG